MGFPPLPPLNGGICAPVAATVAPPTIVAPPTTAFDRPEAVAPVAIVINGTASDRDPWECYSEDQKDHIKSIAKECEDLFPVGVLFGHVDELRAKVKSFAHKKGFSVYSDGTRFACSRCDEPQHRKNKRAKNVPVPPEKRRVRKSTRVGCSFLITFSPVDGRNYRTNKAVKITKSTNYFHSNGCYPSLAQLAVEKRKSGAFTAAIHETQIKAILSVMSTGSRVQTSLLRDMMRPLYPPGTALDAMLIFNFRLKIKRMLQKGIIDMSSYTVTEDDERKLLESSDLDRIDSPEFLTDAFRQFRDLLQEAMKDENDIKQITNYLSSLSQCDKTFTYRVGRAQDGSVTGFVWQTGVMRRDFELFGDVLFIDCQGRSLNNKGWPLNTIAMLDGDRRLCLPCEGITIAESIDGYAWMIRSAVEMAPLRKVDDIKVIYGDGIIKSSSLLQQLGIVNSCKLVLDHHHLLSEDIGAWPKEFGLSLWSQLKDDLTKMVKSTEVAHYNQSYSRVRDSLRNSSRLLSYLDEQIHKKRHMFAAHIVQTYHGNMQRKGNSPAETNHSSVIRRLGDLVLSPVEFIKALLSRHYDITCERNHKLQKYHLESSADSHKARNQHDGVAVKSLSSWAYKLYRQSLSEAKKVSHSVRSDGHHVFDEGHGHPPLTLGPNPMTCQCLAWTAFNGSQCCHLLLAHGGFRLDCWSKRWLQRTTLETSHDTSNTSYADGQCPDNDNDDEGVSMICADDEEKSVTSVNLSQQSQSSHQRMAMRDVLDLARDVGLQVKSVRNKDQQRLLLGALLKIGEIAKGNLDSVSALGLEETLNNHLNLFTRHLPSQSMFSQTQDDDKENRPMSRANPSGTSGGSRFKSANERRMESMRNSNKRPATCALCHCPGHRVGRNCSVVSDLGATVISHKEMTSFCASLGNPVKVLVQPPTLTVKEAIRTWTKDEQTIPSLTKHILVRQCFFSARPEHSFMTNIVEVDLLGEMGQQLTGYCPSYYPVHVIHSWIEKNCSSKAKKRVVLSSLKEADPNTRHDLYNYSPN
jgi:hypothetical protein